MKIFEKNYINLIKEKFPRFVPYWDSHVSYWGSNQGLTIQILPFFEYALEVIKNKEDEEIKRIFEFVEISLSHGEESVKNAIATSFIEALLNKDPDEIKISSFVIYFGINTISYCREWDKFTGNRTNGIWPE